MKFKAAITIIAILFSSGAWASDDDCRQGHQQCGHEDGDDGTIIEVEGGDAYAEGGDALAQAEGGAGGAGGSVGDIDLDNDVATGNQKLDLAIAGPNSSYIRTEAVRVAPAFGTNCYEAMNASLLDKGFSIGSANAICQALQVVDVWFALAAVTDDPVLAAEYTAKGMKTLDKTTRLVNRKLSWNNVKSFFQEVGVPIGLVALLL